MQGTHNNQGYHPQSGEMPTYSLTHAGIQQHYHQQMSNFRQQNSEQAYQQQQQPVDMMYPISELVPVPESLSAWAAGGHIQAVLLKVKDRAGVGYISSQTSDSGKVSILIHAPSPDSARTARLLIEIHFKEQIKFMSDMNRLNKMQENLFEVQGEVAAGQRIEFKIPVSLIGLAIGKGGQRIKEVTADTGVSDIFIDGETGLVKVSGPSPASVQAAKDRMDIVEEKVDLTTDEAISMLRDNSYLSDLKEMSSCIIVRIPHRENFITLVGNRSCITSAKLILETQKDYINKRMQVKESEGAIRDQLRTFDKNAGGGGRPPFFRNDRRGEGKTRGGVNRREGAPDSLQSLKNSSDNKRSSDSKARPPPQPSATVKSEKKPKNIANLDNDRSSSKSSKSVPSGESLDKDMKKMSLNNSKEKPKSNNKKSNASPPSVVSSKKIESTNKKTSSSTMTTTPSEDVNAIAAALKESTSNRKRNPKKNTDASSLENLPTPPAKSMSEESKSTEKLPESRRKKATRGGKTTATTTGTTTATSGGDKAGASSTTVTETTTTSLTEASTSDKAAPLPRRQKKPRSSAKETSAPTEKKVSNSSTEGTAAPTDKKMSTTEAIIEEDFPPKNTAKRGTKKKGSGDSLANATESNKTEKTTTTEMETEKK